MKYDDLLLNSLILLFFPRASLGQVSYSSYNIIAKVTFLI